MGTAARIRDLRNRSRRSEVEIAQIVGVNIYWYGDLESYDDELISTLSMSQAIRLATALGTPLRELVSDGASAVGTIAAAELMFLRDVAIGLGENRLAFLPNGDAV